MWIPKVRPFGESRSSCKDESHEKCRVNEDKSPGLLLVWESRVGNFRTLVDLQTAAERFVLISFHGTHSVMFVCKQGLALHQCSLT